MKPFIRTLFVGAAIAALATAVWSQTITNQTISGNECWNAGQGPGGPSQFLCINQVRNGAAITLVSGAAQVITTTPTLQQGTLMWTGTAPTSWAVTLPNPAYDGEILCLGTDTVLTTITTVTAGTSPQNQTLANTFTNQTVAVGGGSCWQFTLPTLKWFKLR